MEIERKWLVDKPKMPSLEYKRNSLDKSVDGLKNSYRIEQYYLNDMDSEWLIRLRRMDDKYFLTLKSKGLLSREELEYEITKSDFDSSIKYSIKSLKKNRYIFEFGGKKYEVDIYDDYDFITCEVEFNSEKEANDFVPPSWCKKDVTNESKYKNVNLAKNKV